MVRVKGFALLQQFGPRSDPTKRRPDLDPNCLTLMVFLKEFFEKKLILKLSADDKTACKIEAPTGGSVLPKMISKNNVLTNLPNL